MQISKNNARMKVNSQECAVWEYEIPSNKMSVASSLINGRYPKVGWAVNKKVEQVYYVISGTAKVTTGKGKFVIKKGDVFYFKKGEEYWVTGKKLRVVVVNAPPWKKKQYEVGL